MEASASTPAKTFECSQCGHCCNTWKVPIEAKRLNALLQRPWVQERLSTFNAIFEPIDDWGAFLPHKPNQECLFWEDEHGCLIHQHEGAAAKPLDCQRFPFSRLPTQETETESPPRFDVSAACSTIAASHLTPQHTLIQPSVLEAASAKESHQHPSPFYPSSTTPLTQYARYPWPFHRYQTLKVPEFQALIEAHVRPLFQGDDDGALPTPWQALALAEGILLQKVVIKHLPNEPPEWWRQHQLALWLRSSYGNYPRWQWRFKGQYYDAQLFGDTCIHRSKLKAISWSIEEQHRVARSFVYHLLRRESALAFGSSLWHHIRMARLGLLLFEFYAPAFALHEGVAEVEPTHMELAIRCIERYYTAHQPRTLARLEASPWLML
jgi:Fe-S-cluster containining protein